MQISRRAWGAVAATVLLPTAVLSPVAQAGDKPRCFGESATIVGTRHASKVVGTAGPDVIFSRWDDQWLYGMGGNDLLCATSSIYGGAGDDRMSVRSEPEFLDMSVLRGGPGSDEIHRREAVTDDPHFELITLGGAGHDSLYGGVNLDFLRGGPGRDRIFGSGMADTVKGGPGGDRLIGGWASDDVIGGSGDDRLRGKGLHDELRGGRGDDSARGGPGGDFIDGGGGMDVANGGADMDTCRAENVSRCESF